MPDRKPIHFIASAKRDLRNMPEEVKDAFGWALLDAQYGEHPEGARPEAVYVLHVFKKKSKSGIATPVADRNLVRARLKLAEEHHRLHYGR